MIMDSENKYQELDRKHREAELGGGPERIAKIHESGRKTARERIKDLLDPETFVEIDKLVVIATPNLGWTSRKFPVMAL